MLAANVNQTSEQLGRLYREIETRTHELAEALTYQTATGEVLKAISRSTLHLQPVLDTLVETATQLCRADKGFLFRLEEGLYRLRASFGFEQEFKRPSKTIRSGPMHQKLWSGEPPRNDACCTLTISQRRHRYTWRGAQSFGGFRTVLGVPLLRDGESDRRDHTRP